MSGRFIRAFPAADPAKAALEAAQVIEAADCAYILVVGTDPENVKILFGPDGPSVLALAAELDAKGSLAELVSVRIEAADTD